MPMPQPAHNQSYVEENALRSARLSNFIDLLRCPETGAGLALKNDRLTTPDGKRSYPVLANSLCLFAENVASPDSKAQQVHYDRVAESYLTNLTYPHTQEYVAYLDREFLKLVTGKTLGTVAELCCGRGEAIDLLKDKMERGVGVDISMAMLEGAQKAHPEDKLLFLQGDATALPLADAMFDNVFMLGGIHHVPNREALFSEVARILKPGGRFYFREPVSDFVLWRAIRAVVYRLSPALDHTTERPLLYSETAPFLGKAQLRLQHWRTRGFIGFCLFMNSDILIFNRLFRFIPGIRAITRFFTHVDNLCVSMPGFSRAGLQVIGVAEKAK